MRRSLGVILFIGLVGAAAIYFAQRPTVARGEVLAADLLESNKGAYPPLKALECDRDVPIGLAGASFDCDVEFKNGDRVHYTFAIDRDGHITPVQRGAMHSEPRIKKTSDPWGD
jgi:hypothetical protein